MANDANVQDVSITSLPIEVIHHILKDKGLHIRDILSLARTCKQLYSAITKDSYLWKKKFFQRWPKSLVDYEEQKENGNISSQTDWLSDVKFRILGRRCLLVGISRMAATYGVKTELSPLALKQFDYLFLDEWGASALNYQYLSDVLVYHSQCPTKLPSFGGKQHFKTIISDIMQRHYARLVNKYMRKMYFARKWRKLLAQPKKRQTMEQAAMFVTKWSELSRRISARKISQMLEDIARQTRSFVAENYSSVAIDSVHSRDLARWKNENLQKSEWSNEDAATIFTALCRFMYENLGFHSVLPEESAVEAALVDHVLMNKYGNPLLLAIIFESVARRLGICCEIVSHDERYLVRLAEKHVVNAAESTDVKRCYLDVRTGDRFDDVSQFFASNGIDESAIQQESDVTKVTERMFAYLRTDAGRMNARNPGFARVWEDGRRVLRSALKLMMDIKPQGTSVIDHMASFYAEHDMKPAELQLTLMSVLDLRTPNSVVPDFPTIQSTKILRHIAADLLARAGMARRKRKLPAKVHSSISCQCCKHLRDFVRGMKKQTTKPRKRLVRSRRKP